MNQETNPFRAAKPYLWDGKGVTRYSPSPQSEFICYALNKARTSRNIKDVDKAKRIISNRMGYSAGRATSLLNWLIQHEHLGDADEAYRRYGDPTDSLQRDLQDYRHRWLDHLAEEWDKGIRA